MDESSELPPPYPHPQVLTLLEAAGDAVLETLETNPEAALRLFQDALDTARALGDRTGESLARFEAGWILLYMGDLESGLAHLEAGLPFIRRAEAPPKLAASLTGIGEAYLASGRPHQALPLLEEALALLPHAPESKRALMLFCAGQACKGTGQLERALDFFKAALAWLPVTDEPSQIEIRRHLAWIYCNMGLPLEAVPLLEEVLSRLDPDDEQGQAEVSFDLGIVYCNIGEAKQALPCMERVVAWRRKYAGASDLAMALCCLGNLYLRRQPEKAVPVLEEALSLLDGGDEEMQAGILSLMDEARSSVRPPRPTIEQMEQASSPSDLFYPSTEEYLAQLVKRAQEESGDKQPWVEMMHSAGLACREKGHLRLALAFYEASVPFIGGVEDKRAAGAFLNNAGLFHGRMGQPREALKLLHKALEMDRAAGNKQGEAATLGNIGDHYRDTGQIDEALRHYEISLEMHRALGNKSGEATMLNNIGALCYTRDPEKALACLKESLVLLRQIGDKRKELLTLDTLFQLSFDQNKIEDAFSYLAESQPLQQELGDLGIVASSRSLLGLFLGATGDLEAAEQAYQDALRLYIRLGDRREQANTLDSIAAIKDAQGYPDEAERNYKAGLAMLEEMREDLGGLSRAKISFLQSNLHIYHSYIRFLLKHRKEAVAFAWAQRIKARGLLDLMAGGKVDISQGLSSEERQREQELTRLVQQLSLDQAEGDLAQAQSERQAFLDRLYVRHPELALKRAARTITLDEMAGFVLADAALLEYVVLGPAHPLDERHGSDCVVLFCVTREGGEAVVKAYPIEKTREELEDECKYLHRLCNGEYGLVPEVVDDQARELYEWLIAPPAQQLAGKRQLIVCPDGPMWGLPFHALRSPSGPAGSDQFLIERFEVSYAYSATAAWAAAKSRDAKAPHPASTMMVMAMPQLTFREHLAEETGDEARSPLQDLGPLPNTLREAEAIQASFPDAVVRIEARAQKAIALRKGGRFRYLHFATHGVLNDAAPLESYIVLAAPAGGSLADSLLTAREIFDLNWNAEMVVLSACHTAGGQEQGGEGLVGLTWALLVAGVPTQVVSQWAASDAHTVDLMAKFYAGIKAGKAKGAAWREAMLALMREEDGRRVHPFYWAPFVLLGDPR